MRSTPRVYQGKITIAERLEGRGGREHVINRHVEVGDRAWFQWLEAAETHTFSFSSAPYVGGFTARRENRSRGGHYWGAYKRYGKKLFKVYLGPSKELSLDRLELAALELQQKHEAFTRRAAERAADERALLESLADLGPLPEYTPRKTPLEREVLDLLSELGKGAGNE